MLARATPPAFVTGGAVWELDASIISAASTSSGSAGSAPLQGRQANPTTTAGATIVINDVIFARPGTVTSYNVTAAALSSQALASLSADQSQNGASGDAGATTMMSTAAGVGESGSGVATATATATATASTGTAKSTENDGTKGAGASAVSTTASATATSNASMSNPQAKSWYGYDAWLCFGLAVGVGVFVSGLVYM